jgi:ankyrin repeat protein
MSAARNTDGADIVKGLIAAGAEVNAKDAKGFTALMIATDWGHLDSVLALVAAGADMHAKDAEGRTALDFAKNRPKLLAALRAP